MIFAEIQQASQTKELYVSAAMVLGSLFIIVLVLFRFDCLQQFWIGRALARWGKGSWSYPASRFGTISGFLLILVLGAMTFDSNSFRIVKPQVWIAAFILVGIYIPSAAIHDFILYKRRKSRDPLGRTKPSFANQSRPRTGSTSIIEPFGSTISAISQTGSDIEILFTPAWARVSRDAGPNWYQDARFILRNASFSGRLPSLPFEPLGSELIITDERHINELPVPLAAIGLITFTLDLDDEPPLIIKAEIVDLRFVGQRKPVKENAPEPCDDSNGPRA